MKTKMIRAAEVFPAIKYRIVDISTLKGLKRAEWYKAHGWIIGSVGFNTIQFYKKS